MSGKCIINGCDRLGDKVIGLKLRRELDGLSAIWGPNSNAYLCDEHAAMGWDIDVNFQPRNDRTIKTSVHNDEGEPIERRWEIRKPVNKDD